MEVKNFQTQIAEFVSAWDKKRGTIPNEQLTFNHLIEEIGELAREYVNQESRPDQFKEEELNNAIADALMQLIFLTDQRGLDIEQAVTDIIAYEQKQLQE